MSTSLLLSIVMLGGLLVAKQVERMRIRRAIKALPQFASLGAYEHADPHVRDTLSLLASFDTRLESYSHETLGTKPPNDQRIVEFQSELFALQTEISRLYSESKQPDLLWLNQEIHRIVDAGDWAEPMDPIDYMTAGHMFDIVQNQRQLHDKTMELRELFRRFAERTKREVHPYRG